MALLSADQGWFLLSIEGGPEFEVYSLEGREKLNEPYEFDLELVSREANVDLIDLLGRQALLTMADHTGGRRKVHGSIREAQQLHTGNAFTHYKVFIVPRLWYLGENENHRVFQNKSVVDIIDQLLLEQKFMAQHVSWKVREKYEAREHCVQYGESDLYFISRLCEEEGIYYYFEHHDDSHILCFSDASGGPLIPDEPGGRVRFFAGSGQKSDQVTVTRLELRHGVHSDTASYREWNFEKPELDLEVSAHEPERPKAPVPGGLNLETYKYPHLYQLKDPGDRYAKLQLLRQLTYVRLIEGRSDFGRLLPGYTLEIYQHPRPDVNAEWWLTEVRHYGKQPQVLRHEAPSEQGFFYQAEFSAIPFEVRFVPEIRHPKTTVAGEQTAIVTGPPGEEIHTDEYGRVKVEFHWDRRDKATDRSSLWVRAAQGWAGTHQYGTVALPRVGQEVVVSFLEGDPDRPLITGRVYHAENKVPYALPADKTKTVFKSLSSPGGGGHNEIRVEDKKGSEEIFLQAEKDLNFHIKNNWKEQVLNNKHRVVDNFSYCHLMGEEHRLIDGPHKEELSTEDHLTVHGDRHIEVMGRWLGKAASEIHLASGVKVVLEAGAEITFKAGGQFIRLTPGGIFTSTPVLIGSGSPDDGSGAAPLLPNPAEPVPAEPGPCIECLKKAAEQASSFVSE
ncbi:type VI secretion system tip protein VgrG [Deltaproteobacteria bacterium Smac51]|nr:type VI secretion system tip protein VgrG [Deltaproteobacteria bacterium Smac51]